jgi:hypothetical protein
MAPDPSWADITRAAAAQRGSCRAGDGAVELLGVFGLAARAVDACAADTRAAEARAAGAFASVVGDGPVDRGPVDERLPDGTVGDDVPAEAGVLAVTTRVVTGETAMAELTGPVECCPADRCEPQALTRTAITTKPTAARP